MGMTFFWGHMLAAGQNIWKFDHHLDHILTFLHLDYRMSDMKGLEMRS